MNYFIIFGEVVGVEIKMDVLMGCLRFVELFMFCVCCFFEILIELNGEVLVL